MQCPIFSTLSEEAFKVGTHGVTEDIKATDNQDAYRRPSQR